MSTQKKVIGLTDQQRRDAINRSLSGLKIEPNLKTRSSKKRSTFIERFRVAFTNAASAG